MIIYYFIADLINVDKIICERTLYVEVLRIIIPFPSYIKVRWDLLHWLV